MNILNDKQLEALTGYRQKAAQVRWLQKNGIRHFVNALGRPVVPVSAIEHQEPPRKGPNLAVVRKAS